MFWELAGEIFGCAGVAALLMLFVVIILTAKDEIEFKKLEQRRKEKLERIKTRQSHRQTNDHRL